METVAEGEYSFVEDDHIYMWWHQLALDPVLL